MLFGMFSGNDTDSDSIILLGLFINQGWLILNNYTIGISYLNPTNLKVLTNVLKI